MNQPDFKQVEKGFGKRTFNRILKLLRSNWILCDGIPGWERTAGGVKPPPIPEPSSIQNPQWGLAVQDAEAATVQITNPGTLKKTHALDNSGLVTITDIGADHTAAVDSWLVLEIQPDLTTTAKVTAAWTGYPQPLDTTLDATSGLYTVNNVYYPLWAFVSSTGAPSDAATVNSTISAIRIAPNADLQLYETLIEDDNGRLIPCYWPEPSVSCLPP